MTNDFSDEAKQSHALEEECLFFVAMSRARTYLRFYQARLQPNGKNRSPSELLAKIPFSLIHETPSPPTVPLPPDAPHSRTARTGCVDVGDGVRVGIIRVGAVDRAAPRRPVTLGRGPTPDGGASDGLHVLLERSDSGVGRRRCGAGDGGGCGGGAPSRPAPVLTQSAASVGGFSRR